MTSAAVWVYYHRHRSPPSAAWVVAHMCFVLCFPFSFLGVCWLVACVGLWLGCGLCFGGGRALRVLPACAPGSPSLFPVKRAGLSGIDLRGRVGLLPYASLAPLCGLGCGPHVCSSFVFLYRSFASVGLWRVPSCGLVVAFVSAEGVLCMCCRSSIPVHYP